LFVASDEIGEITEVQAEFPIFSTESDVSGSLVDEGTSIHL